MAGRLAIATALLLGGASLGRAAGAPAPKASTAAVSGAGNEFDQFEGEFGEEKGKPAKTVKDPLQGFNRAMFKFNDKFYFWFAKPVAKVYGFILPEPIRVAVGRAFDNLQAPMRMVNHALQCRPEPAASELGRFLLNSTVGFAGLFDPADLFFHTKQVDADFGQTMGHYGVGIGAPLVLPLWGQTTVRDGLGLVPNSAVDPTYYFTNTVQYLGLTVGGKMNLLSLHIGDYEKVKKDALDPYTFIRDATLQNREEKIKESRGKWN